MRSIYRIAATLAAGAALGLGAVSAQAQCSDKNWKACAGKPWVDGSNMETPLGSKWWPKR